MTTDIQRSDVLGVVAGSKDAVFDLGRRWMATKEEADAAEAAGLVDWQLYFIGRHGVLGDVDPDVVVAAAYWFEPEHVAREWDAARAVLTVDEGVELYLRVLHDWGRDHLADFAGNERLVELSEEIIDEADVAGLPLFAGWRALPVPHDPPARCAHAMQVLREHRGGCHGVAMVAIGMSPLMTILTNDLRTVDATDFGWPPPFPEVTDADRHRRARIERLTDELVALSYETLSPDEGAEFVGLLQRALDHVGPTPPDYEPD